MTISPARTSGIPSLRGIAEESGWPKQQQRDDEHEAEQERGLRAERRGDDRVDESQHEPAQDGAGDAAESAENDDDERFQERLLAHHRVELEDRGHERSAGRRQREADRERKAVDHVYVDVLERD